MIWGSYKVIEEPFNAKEVTKIVLKIVEPERPAYGVMRVNIEK